MAGLIFLDTHVAVWLYAGELALFSEAIRQDLDRCDLLISPAVVLEIQYLHEIDRLTVPSRQVIDELNRAIGLKVDDISFAQVIDSALDHNWTRDPFDRLITAQAALGEHRLLTRDRTIRDHYRGAYWH